MDERLSKFAADLNARLGARAHLVAQEQASNTSEEVAEVWRKIADNIGRLQGREPETLTPNLLKTNDARSDQNGGADISTRE